MKFTLDTQVGTLLDQPEAKKVLDKYIPGLSTNPLVGMIRGLTINMLLAMPQAKQLGLTKEKAEQLLAEINKQIK